MPQENQAIDLSSQETQKEEWKEEEIRNAQGIVIGTKQVRVEKEVYKEIIFSHKSDKNDTTDVILAVDGQVLTIQRGVKVIVPGKFLVCADHGWHYVYEQKPGHTRKVGGKIYTYPYTVIRDNVPASEYFKMKREGDKKTKELIEKKEMVGAEI